MAGKVATTINNTLNEISAMQTLIENFPMSLISFGDLKFGGSFDVLHVLFKMFGITREDLVKKITDKLCGSSKDNSDGEGFLGYVEQVVKLAILTNISNIANCITNPIIDDDLLDSYTDLSQNNIEKTGAGVKVRVSEIDMTGVLNKNPFSGNNDKFYFDVEQYNPNNLYKSKDFNAFLWYILNKSDKSQNDELIWKNENGKEIIRCTYVDDNYPNSDSIIVQICGARNGEPANYFKTRTFFKKTDNDNDNAQWYLNETIFQFNYELLKSVKLYDSKVVIAEIVESLMGSGTINIGFSINEQIIEAKIQKIIKTVIETDDLEVSDCYFTFTNDEFNEMLENSERKRFNVVNNNGNVFEADSNIILAELSGITSTSSKIEDKTTISKTLYEITATPAQDPSSIYSLDITYDWSFELVRSLLYPFVRPLFTPKVMFLLMLNREIMGEPNLISVDELMKSLFVIIKDIVVKIKDLIIDMFLNMILEKLDELLAIFASKLLLETLNNYRSLLEEIIEKCSFGWTPTIGVIDNVNYAEITQTEPNQSIC